MLTMKDIIREGHSVLRKVADHVEIPVSPDDMKIAKQMIEFVINSQDPDIAEKYDLRPGIGLAAPQIAISKRIIAVHLPDEGDGELSCVVFNPKIVSHSVEMTHLENGEGCLSVDREVAGPVPRYARITVKGYDMDNQEVTYRLKGLPAIVFQHEIDHLNGIMFYDRIEGLEDKMKKEV
ncbi:peptide deformylase [Bacillus alkalicellulosilyticus]|uniref:peptide deformylase n=1 Tax=Alkalihalobacterium alkalicellulosilyticum TaxID=1912214 RepID=UPI0009973B5E|nr:peptide deformylase [Bacillus alkalicellulosilyticus]